MFSPTLHVTCLLSVVLALPTAALANPHETGGVGPTENTASLPQSDGGTASNDNRLLAYEQGGSAGSGNDGGTAGDSSTTEPHEPVSISTDGSSCSIPILSSRHTTQPIVFLLFLGGLVVSHRRRRVIRS